VTVAGWLVLAGVVGFVLVMVISSPMVAGLVIGAIVICSAIWVQVNGRRLRRLAEQRTGEDIGTFARAFDRRTGPFDPWVVRATWDALQPYMSFRDGQVPLRPTDRLEQDLRIDPDDLDLDIVVEIADRAGYSLDQAEANPMHGNIRTVRDLVKFITRQPKRKDADVKNN
jgi:hypothetical protein